MKKRNFFKTLSSAVLGALTIGSCSNVWMMEGKRLSAATLAFGHGSNARMMEKQTIKNYLFKELASKIANAIHDTTRAALVAKKLAAEIIKLMGLSSISEQEANSIVKIATQGKYLVACQVGDDAGCRLDRIASGVVAEYKQKNNLTI